MRSEVQLLLGPPASVASSIRIWCGALAQLVEHLLCKQGVNGSNPLSSTIFSRDEDNSFRLRPDLADLPPFFDIVNGFFNRCRGGMFGFRADHAVTINQIDYLAEIILSATLTIMFEP